MPTSRNRKMRAKTKKKGAKSKESTYSCPECDKNFSNSSLWKAHLKLHTTEHPYKCELCHYTCKIKKYLSRHVKKVHTKPVGNQCTVCGKCFHFDCNLQEHMRVHTGEKPYKCKICGKAFSSSYSLSVHKLIHTGEKPYQCAFCDYACRDNSTIRRHQDRHMGISKDYPCSICTKIFKTKTSLQIHVDEVHFELDARKNPCEQCDKLFKTKASLRLHVNTVHNKANRVKCEICDAKVTRNNLQAHMRRHVDVKPYKCSYKACGRKFKHKGDLKKHSLIHYPYHQYQCDICERRFARKHRLNAHARIHQSKKYVECHHCGVTFSTKMYLAWHIRKVHGPNSKQYICDICQVVTYTRKSIIMHLKYGHGTEKDTSCQICNIDLRKYLSLKDHYAKRHGIKYSLLPKKKENRVVIKEEPYEVEITTETDRQIDFTYEVDIQKHELEVEIPEEISPQPKYPIDTDTIAYSRRVFSEDISRTLLERGNMLDSDDFFIGQLVRKQGVAVLPTPKINKRKEEKVKQCVKKLLSEVRMQKEWKALEELRRQYNRRIKMATSSGNKPENKTIRYYKKTESNTVDNEENNKSNENDDTIQDGDRTGDENSINQENDSNDDKIGDDTDINEENDKNDDDDTIEKDDDNDYRDSGTESDEIDRRKLKFNTHQCYICFKLFKTKSDLKRHCTEHFDICNEKMLKKCPFCGYVTNLQIARHLRLVHKVFIDIPYGKVKERNCEKGSKYVLEIDKNCELEIIPSISNLNKIASMKIDEQNRKSKNVFLGKTKLVKQGQDWIVEKQPVNLNNDNLLPEFSEQDYQKLKIIGDGYLNRIKSLSFLAKTKGIKMLFPCSGCEKICLTMSALKLHSRKHENNPKAFKPKVWKNKILNGYSKNKKERIKKKTNKKVGSPKIKIRDIDFDVNKVRCVGGKKLKVNNDNKNTVNSVSLPDNRFASPNPVKNKHKCDKELIEFYKKNIRGKDIEFWQFLKIYNKMGRENVNDFKDLENRTDFGMHRIYNNSKVDDRNNTIINNNNATGNNDTQNDIANKSDKDTAVIRKVGKVKKKFTRAIMISKKEYLKRNKIKEEMRKRLKESKSLDS